MIAKGLNRTLAFALSTAKMKYISGLQAAARGQHEACRIIFCGPQMFKNQSFFTFQITVAM
jgi:hypothetical protein